jgi:hypothetical protein
VLLYVWLLKSFFYNITERNLTAKYNNTQEGEKVEKVRRKVPKEKRKRKISFLGNWIFLFKPTNNIAQRLYKTYKVKSQIVEVIFYFFYRHTFPA